MYIDIFVFW